MKDVTKSIKVVVLFCVALVLTLTGCKEEHAGDPTTHISLHVNGGEEPQSFSDDIPGMTPGLVKALEESEVNAPVFNFTFSENGDITLMVNPEYDRGTPSSAEASKEINRVTAISIVDFKNNPGCWWINLDGSERLLCKKI